MSSEQLGENPPEKRSPGRPRLPDDQVQPATLKRRQSDEKRRREGLPHKERKPRIPRKPLPDDQVTHGTILVRRSKARARGEIIPYERRGKLPLPDDQASPSTLSKRRSRARAKGEYVPFQYKGRIPKPKDQAKDREENIPHKKRGRPRLPDEQVTAGALSARRSRDRKRGVEISRLKPGPKPKNRPQ